MPNPRRSRRALFALFLATVAATACTSASTRAPASAPATTSASATVPASSSSTAPPTSPPAAGLDRLMLKAPADGSFLVHGHYPHVDSPCRRFEQPELLARYPGTMVVSRQEDGSLSLLLRMPFERYLEGIAEVPSSWPRAALRAQAIAARSYALSSTGWTGEGQTLDSPICATTSCQVYRGIPVPFYGSVRRWWAAVHATRGQVLMYGDRPADTVYFSTSNGHTYGNEDVFGSDPLPYLRPKIERDDGASPTSRWRTALPFHHLGPILAMAGAWPKGVPIRHGSASGDTVTLTGGSHRRTIDAGDLRDDVNTWAPCRFPGRYPPRVAGGTLPLTIPSSWSTVTASDGGLTVSGRGWGHGVGMVQWGAYGKARKGWSTDRILGFYYGGLRPTSFPEPGQIAVQVASGLTSVRLLASGRGASIGGGPLRGRTVVLLGGPTLRVQRR